MPARKESDPTEDRDSWRQVHDGGHLPQLTQNELDQMKAFYLSSKSGLKEDAAPAQFLQGDIVGAIQTHRDHHHARIDRYRKEDLPCGYA